MRSISAIRSSIDVCEKLGEGAFGCGHGAVDIGHPPPEVTVAQGSSDVGSIRVRVPSPVGATHWPSIYSCPKWFTSGLHAIERECRLVDVADRWSSTPGSPRAWRRPSGRTTPPGLAGRPASAGSPTDGSSRSTATPPRSRPHRVRTRSLTSVAPARLHERSNNIPRCQMSNYKRVGLPLSTGGRQGSGTSWCLGATPDSSLDTRSRRGPTGERAGPRDGRPKLATRRRKVRIAAGSDPGCQERERMSGRRVRLGGVDGQGELRHQRAVPCSRRRG